MIKELVIAAYDKDYNWVKNLNPDVSITVYRKGNNSLLDKEILITPNLGRDVHTFFSHLYNRYDTLSDVTFFSQDSPFDHVYNYVDIINGDKKIWDNQSKQNNDGCWFFSHHNIMRSGKNGSPNHPGIDLPELDIEKTWNVLFNKDCPEFFDFTPAGHFAITKEQVHRLPKQFYKKVIDILETRYTSPWEIERLEPYIFLSPLDIKLDFRKNALIIPVYNSLHEHEQYKKCIKTWEFYCKKHNIELHLLTGEKYFNNEPDYAAMCYDRWTEAKFPISEYDRVTFVDADTIVRWDFDDFNKIFNIHNLDIVVVPDQGGNHVGPYHTAQWSQFNPNSLSIVKNYFNAGFVSMKSEHLIGLQKVIGSYKEYYYTHKDIEGHVKGIGKKGGVRLDAMDQTAVNISLQELYPNSITFVQKDFNCQVPYLFNNEQDFRSNYHSFDFLNEGVIFHLGSSTLAYTNLINDFWTNFKEKYK